jgi:hypothetical protein
MLSYVSANEIAITDESLSRFPQTQKTQDPILIERVKGLVILGKDSKLLETLQLQNNDTAKLT